MGILQVILVITLVLSGMGVAILGSIKLQLARELNIDEARMGGLVSLFGFTMMPIILLAGFLTDLLDPEQLMFGRQVGLIAGSAVFAASLIILAWARSYAMALTAVLCLSGGWSLLVNVGNVLTPLAFPGQSLAFSTNLANVFFGLGAFLTPLATSLLVRSFSLKRALMLLAFLALIPGVLGFLVDFTELRLGQASARGTMRLLDEPYLWLLGLALFFYGPLEASMGAWATTYLTEKGYKESAAANWLSVFWLAYMTSRLIAAFTVPPGFEATLVLILAVASVMVLADMVASGRGMAALSVLFAGLVFGPIFPTLMALLLGHFDPAVQGRAVGIFFAIGGIGWTGIPILIGAYARRTSVQKGFTIAVAAALGLCGVALTLVFGSWR